MLSQSYDVESRPVTEPTYRDELTALGFDLVPVAVIGGRAFVAFPDEVVERELGVSVQSPDVEEVLARFDLTLEVLDAVVRAAEALPDSVWPHRLAPQRDRPLGQWVWHIFYFAHVMTATIDRGAVSYHELASMEELSTWSDVDRFRSFESIAAYGSRIVDELRAWRSAVTDERLLSSYATPWGALSGVGLLSHLDRHSAVHLRQILEFADEHIDGFAARPSADVLARMPTFGSLSED